MDHTAHSPNHIALIGCGNMGGAILHGWLAQGILGTISVIDRHVDPAQNKENITYFSNIAQAKKQLAQSDIIVLAVKPQALSTVCADLKSCVPSSAVILSVAAGQSLEKLSTYFAAMQPIIRTMPNTASAIGKGITAAIGNTHTTDEHQDWASSLMRVTGLVEWIHDETLMDAITAVAGSGPAYFFHLSEILTKAGIDNGLPADLARRLARQTFIGAGALAEAQTSMDIGTLRGNVTSPGGTTEAALNILMDGRWQSLFNEAITEATRHGQRLNKP